MAWLACLCVSAEAVYLAFVLFFVYLHLLGMRRGTLAVCVATVVAVVGFAAHNGWSVAALIGPVLGAGVAVVISAGYRGLYAEVVARQQLIDELVATGRTWRPSNAPSAGHESVNACRGRSTTRLPRACPVSRCCCSPRNGRSSTPMRRCPPSCR